MLYELSKMVGGSPLCDRRRKRQFAWQGLAVIFSILVFLGAAAAQTLPSEVLLEKTQAALEDYAAEWDGVIGYSALDLGSGAQFGLNSDVVFPQASSIKIAIMVEVFRQAESGLFGIDSLLTILPAQRVGGSGRYQERLAAGETISASILEVVRAMNVWSDNVATNVLIALVGMERVNRMLKSHGFAQTRLQRVMMDVQAVARNDENISTPMEMVRLMQAIFAARIVSAGSRDEILKIMSEVSAAMRKAVPPGIDVASKPGSFNAVRCETGIVFLAERPFAIAVMSTYNGEQTENPVEFVTAQVFDYFERLAHSNVYGHRHRSRPARGK